MNSHTSSLQKKTDFFYKILTDEFFAFTDIALPIENCNGIIVTTHTTAPIIALIPSI